MWTRVSCIILAVMLTGPIAKAGSSLPPGYEAHLREELRPKGDFRELVYAGIASLQTATGEESRCEATNNSLRCSPG